MLEYLPFVFDMVCKVPVCYFFEIIVVIGYFYPRLLWSYGFLAITVEHGVSYRAELFLLFEVDSDFGYGCRAYGYPRMYMVEVTFDSVGEAAEIEFRVIFGSGIVRFESVGYIAYIAFTGGFIYDKIFLCYFSGYIAVRSKYCSFNGRIFMEYYRVRVYV